MRKDAEPGFTLIELLMGVAIISILLLIAVPSYQQYVVRSHRETAKAALADVLAQVARLRARGAAGSLPAVLDPMALTTRVVSRYRLQLTPNPIGVADFYWIMAVPNDPAQQGDGGLTLTSNGQGCWHLQNDVPTDFRCAVTDKAW